MKKKQPRKKRETLPSLRNKVWHLFSIYIRTRDCLMATGSPEYGECITCGEPLPFKELQAGHFVPKHSGNYFSERGVHTQCRTCNLFGKDGQAAGMPHEYRRQMVRMYGEDVTCELEQESRKVKKFTLQELEELKVSLQEKIKQLKKEE